MTLEEIKLKIQEINAMIDDDEMAHHNEDFLYKSFIKYISENPNDSILAEKAKLILTTQDIDFSRWCA
jgi:hypothetical protein